MVDGDTIGFGAVSVDPLQVPGSGVEARQVQCPEVRRCPRREPATPNHPRYAVPEFFTRHPLAHTLLPQIPDNRTIGTVFVVGIGPVRRGNPTECVVEIGPVNRAGVRHARDRQPPRRDRRRICG